MSIVSSVVKHSSHKSHIQTKRLNAAILHDQLEPIVTFALNIGKINNFCTEFMIAWIPFEMTEFYLWKFAEQR